jgi:uncharacterized protein YjbI with pentapeptide repeats
VGANLAGIAAGADMRNQSMGPARLSLMNADLTNANLAGADLSGDAGIAEFNNADSGRANLGAGRRG